MLPFFVPIPPFFFIIFTIKEIKNKKKVFHLNKKYTFAKILINQFNTKMKKVLSLIAIAGMFAFVACGPSAEEKAKMEQAKADSIAAAEAANAEMEAAKAQATADSMAAAATADTTQKMEETK